ncbi:MAG: hypothetical protein ACQSGP_00225 [Frankia sp.]
MSTRTPTQKLRGTLAKRRDTRRGRVHLERQLAAYTSQAARSEIQTIVARHTAEEAAPVARILLRRAPASRS